MFNPFDRMRELIKDKGNLNSSVLYALELQVVLELLEESSLSTDAKLFIRKFLGISQEQINRRAAELGIGEELSEWDRRELGADIEHAKVSARPPKKEISE